METPEDLLYTDEHEWIERLEGGLVRIGVTDYAQDQLGDVVYVELPEVGRVVAKDDLVNTSPYGDGWLVEITLEGEFDAEGLLDAAAYRDLTE